MQVNKPNIGSKDTVKDTEATADLYSKSFYRQLLLAKSLGGKHEVAVLRGFAIS